MNLFKWLTNKTGKLPISLAQAAGITAVVGAAGFAAMSYLSSPADTNNSFIPPSAYEQNGDVVYVSQSGGGGQYEFFIKLTLIDALIPNLPNIISIALYTRLRLSVGMSSLFVVSTISYDFSDSDNMLSSNLVQPSSTVSSNSSYISRFCIIILTS